MTTIPTPARRRLTALATLLPGALALLVAVPAQPAAAGTIAPLPALAAPGPVPVTAPGGDPATTSGTGTHVVVPGETLSGIAAAHGTTVSALAAANGLGDPDHVLAGTTLTVPAGGGGGASTPGGEAADGGGGAGAVPPGLPARLAGSPTRLAYLAAFDEWAAANGIPADLLKAMTWLESGWQNHLVSSTGAVGIGQLMPDTVDFMELLIGADLDPAVPEDNIRMAARYLRWLLERHPSTGAALAAYYQGPASVARNGTFAETDTYVANVLALRHRF